MSTLTLTPFTHPEFGRIRTLDRNGDTWFIARDIAQALGYAKTQNAIATHVEDSDKTTALIQGPGSNYKSKTILINESGLYALILASHLPSAKAFKNWVTAEVLPGIRKNGGYLSGQTQLGDTELMAKALVLAQNIIHERTAALEATAPKVCFANAVAASHQSILVGELAKLIAQNGVDIGAKRLFTWLRDKGYLIKGKRSDRNMPTQKSMDQGLFEIKETAITHSDGHTTINRTPKVTGKGQVYFINRFLVQGKRAD